ncbi:MAG: hypothetical protein JJ934_12570 [Pseudomonadales bacterium]|nr:hypothetical protein [Pseudomonadales bacterium]MBO6564783.1 hypothetical protein [Pseudomonadales bacterium]MBO6597022.1 hypothetical protein [Pseudomonadales bacterium]MBO6657726.1 hypothetical protein [Pseudomonadales bacterium]MBO6703664.1 hypothetical protein [Pseudomonadales bacterium]
MFKYAVDRDRELITLIVGPAATADFLGRFEAEIRNTVLGHDELIILAGVSELTGKQIEQLAFQTAQRPRETEERESNLVLVAGTDLEFGVARMYAAYRQKPERLTQVFRDLQQALEWLQLPGDYLKTAPFISHPGA